MRIFGITQATFTTEEMHLINVHGKDTEYTTAMRPLHWAIAISLESNKQLQDLWVLKHSSKLMRVGSLLLLGKAACVIYCFSNETPWYHHMYVLSYYSCSHGKSTHGMGLEPHRKCVVLNVFIPLYSWHKASSEKLPLTIMIGVKGSPHIWSGSGCIGCLVNCSVTIAAFTGAGKL